ncbi:hypothetical protein N7478_012886 [Penicillium angulare]|uniref:uncharacterized protein n=1 Tax=Penicillium angulare TaxID=116970 RepID=UPI002542527B|nr:uncharacterized protein N7478_012886 [Penicillium angulare]KAJ5256782.1 hypothetical protein N7478_012886 [Penicillium angulare]
MRTDYIKNFSRHYGWRSHILQDMEEWRQYLQPHSDPQSKGYTSQGWVGMAFNYTVLLLHRPTKENVGGIVSEKCLQACADIITVFRKYQKDRETAQLWPGSLTDNTQLLSQFGIGITLLYCFWATPPSSRSDLYRSPKTITAIRTCSVILAVFSEQWVEAEPLRDLFDVLSESILYHAVSTKDNEANRIAVGADADADSIKSRIPHIRSLVVNTDICRMVTEMVTEDFPWQDPRNNDSPAWASEIHSSESCFLCENERQEEGSTSPVWVDGFEPSSANLNTHYDDDLFAFPGLFGSVEF